jgi:hypothetical protein
MNINTTTNSDSDTDTDAQDDQPTVTVTDIRRALLTHLRFQPPRLMSFLNPTMMRRCGRHE